MGDEIDIGAETAPDPTTDFRARARKAAETNVVPPQAKADEPPLVSRETDFTVTLHDPWTGSARATWRVTSRVFDGPEHAAAVRYAAHLAGVSMDALSREDREWFRSLARAELQIRAVSGGPLGPDAKADKRLEDFINRLWSDPELLALTTRRLGEHEERFRFGDPPAGASEAKFPRVVVGAL